MLKIALKQLRQTRAHRYNAMMRFWDFGRSLAARPFSFVGGLALCLLFPLIWQQLHVNAQEEVAAQAANDSSGILFYLPLIITPPGPPNSVEVTRFNNTSLITCGVSAMTHAGDDRLFVAQQDGLIRVLMADGTVRNEPFIDLTSQVTQACSEQRPQAGLLGLAFHPEYDRNGQFFVTYTRQEDEAIVLSRFNVSIDPNQADLTSEVILFVAEKPAQSAELTYNGGALAFGPAGHLFVTLGDGGVKPGLSDNRPGDPNNHGQRLDNLLGKVLRLDVDTGEGGAPDCGEGGYRVPSNNGFVDGAGGNCDEVWASGLHAPWGIASHIPTGQTFFVDSAEYERNEVNRFIDDLVTPNFGWRCAEGSVNHAGEAHVRNCPASETLEAPTVEYGLSEGCRIIGGQIHGPALFTLADHYLFSDACQSGRIGRVDITDPELPFTWMTITNLPPGIMWNAGGADAAGRVYFSEFSFDPAGPINIYRVTDPQIEP